MSLAVLDRVEQQEDSSASIGAVSATWHIASVEVTANTSPRWIDEEDDGVAVRSYD